MKTFIPIRYRDFYDFPRMFLVECQGSLCLFNCCLNEKHEDYESFFYLIPELSTGAFIRWRSSPSGLGADHKRAF